MGIEGWIECHFRAWRRLGQGRLDFRLGLGHRSSLGSLAVSWMLRLLTKSLHSFRTRQGSQTHRRSVARPM